VNDADRLLLTRIGERDEAAWQLFIDRFEGRLVAYVRKRMIDATLSEDIVQETFVGFLTSLPNYDGETPIESFLYSIAAHKIVDALRKQGRRPTVPLVISESRSVDPVGPGRKASSMMRSRDDRSIEQYVVRQCLTDLIEGWLRSREFERLQCAELLFVLGRRNRDVADVLGLSEQAVANHKYAIVAKLKEAGSRKRVPPEVIEELCGSPS
jgi:RNA polymerase sigma-70 factor, ECF subfamily